LIEPVEPLRPLRRIPAPLVKRHGDVDGAGDRLKPEAQRVVQDDRASWSASLPYRRILRAARRQAHRRKRLRVERADGAVARDRRLVEDVDHATARLKPARLKPSRSFVSRPSRSVVRSFVSWLDCLRASAQASWLISNSGTAAAITFSAPSASPVVTRRRS